MRKPRGFTYNVFAFSNLVNMFLKMWLRDYNQAEHDYLTEIRADKLRKDIEVLEMRRQKLMNDLVLQDGKILQQNLELGIGDHEFRPVAPE